MNPKELIALNNEKRKQLTKENEEIYGEVLVYVRMSNISEADAETVLMELLDHLLDAQANGKTAQEVFGKDPKAFCHDLIEALPKAKFKENVKMFFPAIFMGLAMWILIDGGNGKLEYSLISLIGVSIVILLYISSMIYGLRLTSFQSKKKSFVILYVIWVIATLAQVAIMLLERFYGEPIIVLTGVPFYIFMGVIGIALLIVDYRTFGVKGVLFSIFLLASQWVGNIPFVENHIKLVLGLVFSLIAFLVMMKAGPKEEKKVPKMQ
ncbi:DUF1129 family protein [Ectobacillus panaciterrae]|uniref:DUF1129 family protein n=1 Tax=Ectobacillus panaciterrae TaxID=363872 RepID=UPI000422A233|nr:DUF1129 family protein [Ectobacillus panaciterrae]